MLDLAPGQLEGRFYLGGAYLKQGKEDAALAEWRKAAEDEPRYFPAVFAVGAVLAGRGEYSEARQWLARAVTLDPDHAFTRFELGRIAYRERNYAEAEKELRAATKLAPELREASYLLASTYRQLGKTQEAQREAARGERLYRQTLQKDIDLLKQAVGGAKR
jgi:tetratricopeptide (TPR) repeat protein